MPGMSEQELRETFFPVGFKLTTLAGGQRGQVLERPARMHRKIKV